MNQKQRSKVRELAKQHNLTNRNVLEDLALDLSPNGEGGGGFRTTDQALAFLEWAYAQDQTEEW